MRTDIDDSVDAFSAGLGNYLSHLDLPVESVLVPPEERLRVLDNVPVIAAEMTPDQRQEAYYISKFVAACSVGLFDAAINFLWNETISNLRGKVAQIDLNYFPEQAWCAESSRRLHAGRGLEYIDGSRIGSRSRLTYGSRHHQRPRFRHLDHVGRPGLCERHHPNQARLFREAGVCMAWSMLFSKKFYFRAGPVGEA